MSDLRTAAQQALERLRQYHYGNGFAEDAKCIADLEAALAQQAEPVRLQQMADAGFKPRDRRLECDECGGKFTAQMLPIHKCAQQAEPVEPVAWLAPDGSVRETTAAKSFGEWVWGPDDFKPLYTAPPHRKPLTKEDEPVLVQGELPPRYVARSPIQAEPLNLTDPAVQKRLAAQWGYVPAAQAEPVEPVATLIAQRDALLEALKQSLEEAIYPSERLSDVYEKARAAIKAVEGEKT